MDAPQTLRIVMIGDQATGKTSLVGAYFDGSMALNPTPTIGVSNRTGPVNVKGIVHVAQVWDTAGQERYRSVAPTYFRHSHGAIGVFDVTNEETFEGLERWIDDYREIVCDGVIVVAANKVDLDTAVVTDEQISEWSQSHSIPVIRTSAFTGEGVTTVFDTVFEQIVTKNIKKDEKDKDLKQKKADRSKKCC